MFDSSSRLNQEAEACVTQPRERSFHVFLGSSLQSRDLHSNQRGPAKGTSHAIFSLLLCNRLVETVFFPLSNAKKLYSSIFSTGTVMETPEKNNKTIKILI